ncbi:lactonase family protein [Lentisphaera marina]|uniref:lactonase family protein n=1 Tax=Lentisphaera marina TaxID=1111041 RepID=UPI002365110C|nr:lactonase family protein [Lentisphaera marina]MDD7984995.1 lactonase family protein [Lentisphaera marina]
MPQKIFLFISILTFLFPMQLIFANDSEARFAYVGSYTRGAPGGWSSAADTKPPTGISVYSVNPGVGDLKLIQTVKSENPAFVVVHPNQNHLYVLNEINDYQGKKKGFGSIEAWKINDKTGKLTFLNRVATAIIPAQIAVSPKGNFLAVATYMGGTYEILPIEGNGRLMDASSVLSQSGTGPHHRQKIPHPHAVHFSPCEKWLLGADLGNDMIKVFQIQGDQLKEISSTKLIAGSGPRHLYVHPDGSVIYVINELNATITVLDFDSTTGKIGKELQTVTTVPQDFPSEKSTAEIIVHPSGKFLYGSNRKFEDHPLADSIVTYRIGKDKKLKLIDYTTEGIKFPRTFMIDPSGTWLYVMNQKGDTIRQYTISPESGKLHFTGFEIPCKVPVSMTFKR